VTAVLSEYEPEIIDWVCDPRTGLPRRLKWLPTVAEIAEACDLRTQYAKLAAANRELAARHRATIDDPNANPLAQYRAGAWLKNYHSRVAAT
jgi:hypothetical protein